MRVYLSILVLLFAACAEDATQEPVDAAADAASRADAPADGPPSQDWGPEPNPDGGLADATSDAARDLAPDVAVDGAPPDVTPDVPSDLAPDVAPDGPSPDVMPDMAPDVAPDVAPDLATMDMGADAPPPPCTPIPGTPPLGLESVAGGTLFSGPVDIQAPPDDPRLFVVERQGTIRIIQADGVTVEPTPFLDISANVRMTGSEQGLLGLAFHPDYTLNGRFFVNYTLDPSGATRVAEFTVSLDPGVADPASEREILTIAQPASNHNGGALAFGPSDGYLYVAVGDGGSRCDGASGGPHAQRLDTMLGKILRIDVDGGTPYAIPPTNPFFGGPEAEEIWAYGMRNPWRISFDRETSDLYIGDVGQDAWEEIDVQPASSTGGENYGWVDYEGSSCQDGAGTSCGGSSCPGGTTLPVHEYPHGAGANCGGTSGSVTGGYVYRGCRMPGYHGTYFFADYCMGTVHSFEYAGGAATNLTSWPSLSATVTTFGQDAQGELYLTHYGTGAIYRIAPQ